MLSNFWKASRTSSVLTEELHECVIDQIGPEIGARADLGIPSRLGRALVIVITASFAIFSLLVNPIVA
jgi:hypothetical protein